MINNSLKKKKSGSICIITCFDVASKMKLCSPKSATGQEEQNKREPFTALAVCGAALEERVFHSHSLLTTPFND